MHFFGHFISDKHEKMSLCNDDSASSGLDNMAETLTLAVSQTLCNQGASLFHICVCDSDLNIKLTWALGMSVMQVLFPVKLLSDQLQTLNQCYINGCNQAQNSFCQFCM